MLFGAQVRQAGGLLAALRRAEAMGAEVMQVFAQSARQWRFPEASPERAAELGAAWPASSTVRAVVCHAPYLVNLGTPDDALYERSCRTLTDNLGAVVAMGGIGLVVHLGSHLGAGLDACLDRLAGGLRRSLDAGGGRLLLENTAGAGGTIGRSFDELARVIDAAGGDRRLGVCLDTQHLWAAGVDFRTVEQADRAVAALDATVGLDRLACLHANDSKVALGAGLDRHENPGWGEIGADGFRSLLGHPALQHLPAVLEVPGADGKGPGPAELATLRHMHADGLARRRGG
jgi:deoxyribonuclease IV